MTKLVIHRFIDAPANRVWGVIADYYNVQMFHPFVEKVDRLSEKSCGLGAKRRCNLYNNTSVVEEVIEWDEGNSFVVLSRDAPMVVEVEGGMRVEVLDEHTSLVTLSIHYIPKWGLLGKLLDFLLLRVSFRFVLSRVLKSLKQHIETGAVIGKGGRPVAT